VSIQVLEASVHEDWPTWSESLDVLARLPRCVFDIGLADISLISVVDLHVGGYVVLGWSV